MLGRNRYQDGCVVLAMRLKRSVGLWILASLVASCGAAPSVATGKAAVVAQAMTAAADAEPPVYAPVLDHDAIHSKADALWWPTRRWILPLPAGIRPSQFPAGGRSGHHRVDHQRGYPSQPDPLGVCARLGDRRCGLGRRAPSCWYGHRQHGNWRRRLAGVDHRARVPLPAVLPVGLAAPDGDHVDVTISTNVIWTPSKTAVETIPASLRSALLDYGAGSNTFGTSSRHVRDRH